MQLSSVLTHFEVMCVSFIIEASKLDSAKIQALNFLLALHGKHYSRIRTGAFSGRGLRRCKQILQRNITTDVPAAEIEELLQRRGGGGTQDCRARIPPESPAFGCDERFDDSAR